MRHPIEKTEGEFQGMTSKTGCFPDKVPRKHDTFIQGCFNVGPPSSTLASIKTAFGECLVFAEMCVCRGGGAVADPEGGA